MLTLPTKVQPGDIITSEFMNAIVDACNELQQKVVALEAPTGGRTQITSLLPSGTKRIGDELHVIGQGFDVTSGNIVTIDGIGVVPAFGADRDRELVVTIPNVQGVTAAGKSVTLLVSNTNGTDMTNFAVFPAVATVPHGQLFVNMTTPPSDPQLLAGQSYTFIYTVQAITDLDETYTLSAAVTTGWTAQIVNASDTPITPAEITLASAPAPAGSSQTVRVRVSIPNGTATGTSGVLRLTVTSKRSPSTLVGISGGETIQVGAAPPASGPITITVPPTVLRTSTTQPSATTTGGVVRIGGGVGNYQLSFSAQIKAATTYNLVLTAMSVTGWSASFSAASASLTKTLGPFGADGQQLIDVFLQAQAGAAQRHSLSHSEQLTKENSNESRQSPSLAVCSSRLPRSHSGGVYALPRALHGSPRGRCNSAILHSSGSQRAWAELAATSDYRWRCERRPWMDERPPTRVRQRYPGI